MHRSVFVLLNEIFFSFYISVIVTRILTFFTRERDERATRVSGSVVSVCVNVSMRGTIVDTGDLVCQIVERCVLYLLR